MARARAQLEQSGQGGTARTDETQVLSVSSAPGVGATQKRAGVSSVLSVGVGAVCENAWFARASQSITVLPSAFVD